MMDNEFMGMIIAMIFDKLPEIMVGISALVAGVSPMLAKKLALKKTAGKLKDILEMHRKISADHTISEKEYAAFGREIYPIVDEFEGRMRGWLHLKSK